VLSAVGAPGLSAAKPDRLRPVKRQITTTIAKIHDWARDASWTRTTDGFRARYDLDPTFRFNGQGSLLYGDGRIIGGAGSYVGWHTFVQAADGCVVRIGRGCRISHGVRFYTRTADADADLLDPDGEERSGDITIGDGVWIGAGVFVGPGISIGDNAVVGANSVVTRDVEPWAIVGGVPARLIRYKAAKPTDASPG
jgi:maltose O-acetyltransferase